jgi:hypothetical protein
MIDYVLVDIHFMNVSCNYPPHLLEYYPVLPYYIPLRAMINRDIENLIRIVKQWHNHF